MLPLTDALWSQLTHAYGSAQDVPTLLERARSDVRPGHQTGSSWFELWSCLCHQGDIYSASYAAVPHLVAIAQARRGAATQFDPLHLVSCIELARLEDRGPRLDDVLTEPYVTALTEARTLIDEALGLPWPREYREALEASRQALVGKAAAARAMFDADWSDEA